MNDKELCEMFGLTLEEVEREVDAVESGDLSAYDFSKLTMGRPMEKEPMEMISTPVPHSRILAIKRVTEKRGESRAEFVRRAIDHELLMKID